jgi:uncharacterized protein YfaP (DUF2135 family)
VAFNNTWKTRRGYSDPFTDLLFNALLGFTYLFLIAVMFMNPDAKNGIIEAKAEYIIALNWPDNDPNDIDLWVEDPAGNIIWFKNREAGLMHLDRDDRGSINDLVKFNERQVSNPLNQELMTIRGIVPGEYVVNLHYYESASNMPVDATVKVSRVNPALEVVYYGTTTLEEKGVEKTALRFYISNQGDIESINHIEKSILLL